MRAEPVYQPETLNERIDYWISTRNWKPMFRIHALMYRLTGGRLGGSKRDIPVLLLTSTGRRTGARRTVPLMYLPDGNRLVVVGSNAGLDYDPDWCFNLRHNPQVTVQLGPDVIPVRARVVTGEERAELWPRVVELNPFYRGFQERTQRTLPLVVLEPQSR